MQQAAIDFTAPEPRARRRDPQTSHKAAERAKAFAPSHAQRIVAVLRRGDFTAAEIADESGLTVVQVRRRAVELERDSKIEVVALDGAPLERDGFRVWGIK